MRYFGHFMTPQFHGHIPSTVKSLNLSSEDSIEAEARERRMSSNALDANRSAMSSVDHEVVPPTPATTTLRGNP